MERQFARLDFENLIGGEWGLIGGGLQAEDAGLFLINKVALGGTVWVHPHGKPATPVLPFPFTAKQFSDFCDWHPTFRWEAIESVFTNDDGSIDHRNLADLTRKCRDAGDLVLIGLGKHDDQASLDDEHTLTGAALDQPRQGAEPAPAPVVGKLHTTQGQQGAKEYWPLKEKVERDDGLATPIHTVLKAAHEAGKARPTAREVLSCFERDRPRGILRVNGDSCDYLDNLGEEQSSDLKKIGKRINEMTTGQRRKKPRKGRASRPSGAQAAQG